MTKVQVYADRSDFCKVFAEDMSSLYLLSFLMTANAQKAEQCFTSALDESSRATTVFKEWTRSWSRRAVIKSAIRMILSTLPQAEVRSISDLASHDEKLDESLHKVLQLALLERFVFVMSILEGYSIQECSILLNRTKRQIAGLKLRAVQQLTGLQPGRLISIMDSMTKNPAVHFLEPMRTA